MYEYSDDSTARAYARIGLFQFVILFVFGIFDDGTPLIASIILPIASLIFLLLVETLVGIQIIAKMSTSAVNIVQIVLVLMAIILPIGVGVYLWEFVGEKAIFSILVSLWVFFLHVMVIGTFANEVGEGISTPTYTPTPAPTPYPTYAPMPAPTPKPKRKKPKPTPAPTPAPVPDHYVTCVNCHSNIKNPTNNLCPSCGKHLYNKDTNVRCKSCGQDYPASEPYCPICCDGMSKPTLAPSPEPEDFFVTCVNCSSTTKNPTNSLCSSCGKDLYRKDTNVHCDKCQLDYPASESVCPYCGAPRHAQPTPQLQ